MTQLFESILQISLSTAAVIGVLLLLVPLWQKRYSAKWRKAIWFIIAVRLLIPFSLELPQTPVQMNVDLQATPAWQVAVTDDAVTDGASVNTTDNAVQTESNDTVNHAVVSDVTVAKEKQLSRGELWALVWLVGAVVFLLAHGAQYAAFRRRVLRNAQPLPEQDVLLQQASDGLNLCHYPNVLLSSKAQGPMLIGFMKSTIILPERIYNERELLLILRHELVHYQQHDLWYKLVLLATNAVHWFNPLVYLMNRQANHDVEQVCDDKVVANQDMDYRKAYSLTILQAMSTSRGIVLSTYLSKKAQNSKKRFAEILYPQKYKRGLLLLCVVIIAAVGVSGCLQVGEKDAGVALYEQVAPWLPENGIENLEDYTVTEDRNLGTVIYHWGEEPVEASDGKGGSLGYYYGENPYGLAGTFRYTRDLKIEVTNDENSEIIYFGYWRDPDDMEQPVDTTYVENKKAGRAYAQQFAHEFAGLDAEVNFFRSVDADNQQTYKTFDTEDGFNYIISLQPEYGYISEYRRSYDTAELEEDVLNWIMGEASGVFTPYKHIKTVSVMDANTQKEVNGYSTTLWYNLYHYANRVVSADYLWEEGREGTFSISATEVNETHVENTVSCYLKIEMDLEPGEAFTPECCKLYIREYNSAGEESWLPISDLSALVGKSPSAISADVGQQAAALYAAEVFVSGYLVNDRDAMAHFYKGDTIDFPHYYYSTRYEEWYPTLQADMMRQYGWFGNNFDEQSKITLTAELQTTDNSYDYLTMQLDRVDGEWQVTGAWLEK